MCVLTTYQQVVHSVISRVLYSSGKQLEERCVCVYTADVTVTCRRVDFRLPYEIMLRSPGSFFGRDVELATKVQRHAACTLVHSQPFPSPPFFSIDCFLQLYCMP